MKRARLSQSGARKTARVGSYGTNAWFRAPFRQDVEYGRILDQRHHQLRNAVEHPGGHSGTLMIENFKITPVGLTPPTWTRVGNEPRRRPSYFTNNSSISWRKLSLLPP